MDSSLSLALELPRRAGVSTTTWLACGTALSKELVCSLVLSGVRSEQSALPLERLSIPVDEIARKPESKTIIRCNIVKDERW